MADGSFIVADGNVEVADGSFMIAGRSFELAGDRLAVAGCMALQTPQAFGMPNKIDEAEWLPDRSGYPARRRQRKQVSGK